MGKASKKTVRKQQKVQTINHKKKIEELIKTMQQQRNATEYEKALETLSELIALKCYDPDVLYTGAYCYFMIGDYTRAADWVNNTLSYMPNHIDARILLGRICILEDRTEDGLSVLDFVLEHAGAGLTSVQKDTMDDILGYYSKYEMEKLKQHYPHIADFCQAAEQKVKNEADNTLKDIEAITASMQKLMDEHPIEDLAQEDTTVPAADDPALAGGSGLQTVPDHIETASAEKRQPEAMDTMDVEAIKKEILQKPGPFLDKIKLLNSFAAVCYFDKKYDEAEMLLQEALQLDSYHEATLRNMAYIMLSAGRIEEALQYASKMSMADFSLLYALRK